MAYPFDGPFFPQAAPPFADPWAAPPMEMQAPDIMDFYEPPQMQSPPDDFFARLGQSQGPQPFQFQPRQGRNARGIDVILAALQGFGNARAAQGVQRTQQVQQGNEQARQGAREMAMWRWRQAQEKRQTQANRDAIIKSENADAARDRRQERGIMAADARQQRALAASEERTRQMLAAQAERDRNRTGNRPARRLTAAENEALADYTTILQQINDVKSTYRPSLVGPVPGFIGGVKQKAGWRMEPGESEMRSALAGVRNTILKMKSGGAVTPDEAKRLLEELATVSNAGPDFEAKLGQFERTLRTKAQTHRDILSVDADLSKYPALPAPADYKYRSGASTGGGAGVGGQQSPGRTVRMKAPDGRTLAVPPEKVAELKAKGAVEF